jgi:FtsH-binding integral membrane protein
MSFVFLCLLLCPCCGAYAKKTPINYILLFGFTLCMAVTLAVTCLFYDAVSVALAAAMTCGVTTGLTAFACLTKIDFTGMGMYLYAGLMTLIMAGLVFSFLPFDFLDTAYAAGGTLVFSLYIVYDTQMIVGGKHKQNQFTIDEYVYAALSIYLDIINLFLMLLSLLSGDRD